MTITIGLFGPLKEAAAGEDLTLEWKADLTAAQARDQALDLLKDRLRQTPSQVLMATETDYLQPDTLLEDGSTIYLLPPFGGG